MSLIIKHVHYLFLIVILMIVECPTNCVENVCDKATGATFACEDGFWGADCGQSEIFLSLNQLCG